MADDGDDTKCKGNCKCGDGSIDYAQKSVVLDSPEAVTIMLGLYEITILGDLEASNTYVNVLVSAITRMIACVAATGNESSEQKMVFYDTSIKHAFAAINDMRPEVVRVMEKLSEGWAPNVDSAGNC